MIQFIKTNKISAISIVLLLGIYAYQLNKEKRWVEKQVIIWDTIYYYGYLPSTFIKHDYKLRFMSTDSFDYFNNGRFWTSKLDNGNQVQKTTMGVAYFYFPFFMIAHLSAQINGYETDGFSIPYQKYIQLALWFYLILGFYFLRKFLLHYYTDWVVAITLITVGLGTNLYYYAYHEPSISHGFSFVTLCVLLYAMQRWLINPRYVSSIVIGICCGLICLIRPVNLVFIIPVFFIGTSRYTDLLDRLKLFFTNYIQLFIIFCAAVIIIFPQLAYWKSVTGSWLYYSYGNEHFYFNNPHIWNGLFSFRKGWLIYTPIMSFALIGIAMMYRQSKALFSILSISFILYLYVIFSWWCWWYGGSYSSRPMIDIYPLLCIPLALFYQNIWERMQPKAIKILVASLMVIFLSLNMFQSWQYRLTLVHYDSMTWEAYKSSFMKQHFPQDFKDKLREPDYKNAMLGLEEYKK